MIPSAVFIAGTMQGDSSGKGIIEQDYRSQIISIVNSEFPDAICYDPAITTTNLIRSYDELIGSSSKILADQVYKTPCFIHKEFAVIDTLANNFMRETLSAEKCDLCIAFLPGSGMSMGTAMEMYSSKLSGAIVITITTNVNNLAILSVTDILISSIDQLHEALEKLRDWNSND